MIRPVPNSLDDLVLRDQAVAVFDKKAQQREDLRLDRDRAAVDPKFDPGRIQFNVFEMVNHRGGL